MSAAATAAAVAAAAPAGAQTAPVEPVPGLEVFPRSAWGSATPPKGPLAKEDDVRFLLVHHTATNTQHRQSEVPALLRSFHGLHTSGAKGWNDIAYNFLVDREGGVWEGRAGSLAGPVRGDATGGNQGFDQLVCLIGDFTTTQPSTAAVGSLARVLAWLADRHGIDTTPGTKATFTSRGSNRWPAGSKVTVPTIAGHRQVSATSCPGDAFFPYVLNQLPLLVQDVRSTKAAKAPAPAPAPTVVPTTTGTAQPPSVQTGSSVAPVRPEASPPPVADARGAGAPRPTDADAASPSPTSLLVVGGSLVGAMGVGAVISARRRVVASKAFAKDLRTGGSEAPAGASDDGER